MSAFFSCTQLYEYEFSEQENMAKDNPEKSDARIVKRCIMEVKLRPALEGAIMDVIY
ncbi:hypothetical protein HMPREF0322_00695 [Desulfitobacterium hafniense DP7]|uniref:Uncharacterized protein n=2 Tax=root TaxID=1 RepID=G9XIB9_DESHA|nr:hypothetical protein HMPREF0322_00695 [Desulfitobacterium hafniense DP7]